MTKPVGSYIRRCKRCAKLIRRPTKSYRVICEQCQQPKYFATAEWKQKRKSSFIKTIDNN